MTLPVYLAHGALGWWDEFIFIGVAIIFLVLMVWSWFKTRIQMPDLDEHPPPIEDEDSQQDKDDPERFHLD